MVCWYFPKIAAAICVQHVYNKDVGIKTLPCQHHSFQRCLSSSGGTGCFHSQVCHCYGKQAAHASQLKSSRLKRARAAAATTVKMLFGNRLLRELYKESKIPGRDAGLVLSHFLAVTNTTKLLSQNKTFLPLTKAHKQGRAEWPYIAGLAMSCSPLHLLALCSQNLNRVDRELCQSLPLRQLGGTGMSLHPSEGLCTENKNSTETSPKSQRKTRSKALYHSVSQK